jgi:hypothetical protein
MLGQLVGPAMRNAKKEAEALAEQAGFPIEPWDWPYYTEKVRQARTPAPARTRSPGLWWDGCVGVTSITPCLHSPPYRFCPLWRAAQGGAVVCGPSGAVPGSVPYCSRPAVQAGRLCARLFGGLLASAARPHLVIWPAWGGRVPAL